MRHPAWLVRIGLFFLLFGIAGLTWADQQGGQGGEEAGDAEPLAFDEPFRPITKEEVDASREELEAAVGELERFFERSDEKEVENWKKELLWDDLVSELAKAKDQVNPGQLDKIAAKYRNGLLKGLEREPFRRLRAALGSHAYLVVYSRDPARTETFYQQQLDGLKTRVAAFREKPSDETADLVGPFLAGLRRTRQAPELVKAVEKQFVRPNFYADISQSLIAAAFDEPVRERTSLREVILGTSLSGSATLVGNVSGAAVPSDDAGAIAIRLIGTAHSTNVGYNGPVTIHSHGRTAIRATTRVLIDENGLRYAKPTASASTSTTIDAICASCALIRKVAWKRALGSKAEAEQIASGKARRRVVSRIESEASELIAEADENYQRRFRTPLLRWDAFPTSLIFSTTESGLRVQATQAADNHVAAFDAPPSAAAPHDMVVQIHETAIANAADRILGGYRLLDERIAAFYTEAGREVPKELQVKEDEPWGLVFSGDKPIQVRFRNGRVLFEIRFRQVLGDEFAPEPLDGGDEVRIFADYELQLNETGIQLVRAPEALSVKVFKDGAEMRRGLNVRLEAVLAKMRTRFGAILTETIPKDDQDGFQLPGRFQRAGKLVGREAKSDAGWLLLGFDRQAIVPTVDPAPQTNETASTAP